MKSGCKRVMPIYNEMNWKKINRIDNDYASDNNAVDDQRNTVQHYSVEQQEGQDIINHQSVGYQNLLTEYLERLCSDIQSNNFLPIVTDKINSLNNADPTLATIPKTTTTRIPVFPTHALDLSITYNTLLNESVLHDPLNMTDQCSEISSPPTSSSDNSLNHSKKYNLISSTTLSSSSTVSSNLFSNYTVPQHHHQYQLNTVDLTNVIHRTNSFTNTLNYEIDTNIYTTTSNHHYQKQPFNYDPLNIINNNDKYTGTTSILTNTPSCDVTSVIPKMNSLLVNNFHFNHNNKNNSNTMLNIQSKDNLTDQLIRESDPQDDEVRETEISTNISKVIDLHQKEFSNHYNGNSPIINNELINPTEMILKYVTNYHLHSIHQPFSNQQLIEENVHEKEENENDVKNKKTSTCIDPDETVMKKFTGELSSKCIESDMHSTPNLIESIKKYHSNKECGYDVCQSSKLREHYHCSMCNKIILRREEMIRHAKWHRKREESMQYGFMRFSPSDDCTIVSCPHNGRQTHYHCMQSNCDKVYISTSDVQMHANYHRKDAVIIQEGFQRFRATENCGIIKCPFYRECTTHFHCRRNNCHFTFKNKGDMEKHKGHHQKNDRFAQDGFRRYIKCENCDFPGCQYSGVINHIHCIRPGCDYVVHSSSQIVSHKRKHDRRLASFSPRYMNMICCDDMCQRLSSPNQNDGIDGEDLTNISENKVNTSNFDIVGTGLDPLETTKYIFNLMSSGKQLLSNHFSLIQNNPTHNFCSNLSDFDFSLTESISADQFLDKLLKFVSLCICRRHNWEQVLSSSDSDNDKDHENLSLCTKIDKILTAIHQSYDKYFNKCCWPGCDLHVNTTTTATTTKTTTTTNNNNNSNKNNSDEDVKTYEETWCKYWSSHLLEACLSFYAYIKCDQSNCPIQPTNDHVHCRFWPKCDFTNPSKHINFQILYKHLLSHDERFVFKSVNLTNHDQPIYTQNETTRCNFALDISHNLVSPRRRGRPPKYTKQIHVPHVNLPENLCEDNKCTTDLTYSMFFDRSENTFQNHMNIDQNLTDNHTPNVKSVSYNGRDIKQLQRVKFGVKLFLSGEMCPDINCPYYPTHEEHYHCAKVRCYMATNRLDLINMHRHEFHQHTIIEQGFEYFDTSIDCRRPLCHNNKIHKHFHCTYPNCDYTFVRASTMQQHSKKHTDNLKSSQSMMNKTFDTINTGTKQPNQPISSTLTNYSSDMLYTSSTLKKINTSSSDTNLTDNMKHYDFINAQLINPLLPLGINPERLLVRQPNAQEEILSNYPSLPIINDMKRRNYRENSLLPGFLPIWAAAMVTAANGVIPMKADSSSELTNGYF
ncbi:unnamed protein product [Schistosoma turkestanicum]|nr:unnamed protein product [Schistosoma turkestanicum]